MNTGMSSGKMMEMKSAMNVIDASIEDATIV